VTEQPFTEEDIQLAARAIVQADRASGSVWNEPVAPHLVEARAVLAALAEAGRLLPPGARVVEEIGVRVDREHPRRKEKVGTVMTHFHRETALRSPEVWDGWSLVRRAAIEWVGPWVPVSEEGIPE
jgi:hypothetical protein